MKRKILLVDDEAAILELERLLLEAMCPEWETTCAASAAAALAALDAEPHDVILSDLNMPGTDGAALLRSVERQHPSVIRFIVSGESELEVARRVAQTAHHFLAKPFDGKLLRESVERACALHGLLDDDTLHQNIGRIGQLPVLPDVYRDVMRAIEDPNVALVSVGTIVARDPVLSAKIVQMVNSAFFGLAQPIARIEKAVCYLGIDVVKCLLLMVDVIDERNLGKAGAESLRHLQPHSLMTARIAQRLVDDRYERDAAFMAGLLHDIGKVVLASRAPERFARLLAASLESKRPMHEVERDRSFVTHAEIGAFLLGHWGLPYPVVEAVAHHHAPSRVAPSRFDVVGAVHVANVLAHELETLAGTPRRATDATLDLPYLADLGVEERVEEWRTLASREFGEIPLPAEPTAHS